MAARPPAQPDQLPYGRSDEVFRDDSIQGDEAVRRLAIDLQLAGLYVRKEPMLLRPTREQASDYHDGGVDLYLGPYPLQVKLRANYRFTGPTDFPYSTILFDTRTEWRRPGPKPKAHVLVSGDLAGYIVIPATAYQYVTVDTRRDSTRAGAVRELMSCPIEHCWTIHQLIAHARAIPACLAPGPPAPTEV